MGRSFLRYSKANYLIFLAAITLWIAAISLLPAFYGQEWLPSVTEAATFTAFLLLGFIVLDNIFRYFSPKKSQWWLLISFPLVTGLTLAYISQKTITLLLPSASEYLLFTGNLLPVKGFIAVLVLLAWSILLVLNSRIEEQIDTKERLSKIEEMSREAELHQLRQQLQPHFLFNSLNSVSALIKSDPERAREMIFQLADFLRGTIQNNKKWLKLKSELEHLELFLSIEKVRFGHRLETILEIDPETDQLKIPQLLLQPLVENAIKHGLYGVTGDVLIKIRAQYKTGNLEISIENPFSPDSGKAKGSGFGLEVVARRLFLIFGRNDLLDTSEDGHIFTVQVKIPQIAEK